MVEKELFQQRRMELFSGCFDCGMPQEICDRWVADDKDGGRFSRVGESRCQHAGLLLRLYAGVYVWNKDRADAVVCEMMRADNFSVDDEGVDQMYRWLGGRVMWGGMEASRLCRVGYRLCKEMEKVIGV